MMINAFIILCNEYRDLIKAPEIIFFHNLKPLQPFFSPRKTSYFDKILFTY